MHTLRWEWYGLVLLTLGQIILVLRAPAASLPDRLWQAWLVGNPALCLGIVTWRPDAWRQHRAWMVPLLRIITHLVPQQRSSRVGAAGSSTSGVAWPGTAWHGRHGMAWPGMAWLG